MYNWMSSMLNTDDISKFLNVLSVPEMRLKLWSCQLHKHTKVTRLHLIITNCISRVCTGDEVLWYINIFDRNGNKYTYRTLTEKWYYPLHWLVVVMDRHQAVYIYPCQTHPIPESFLYVCEGIKLNIEYCYRHTDIVMKACVAMAIGLKPTPYYWVFKKSSFLSFQAYCKFIPSQNV